MKRIRIVTLEIENFKGTKQRTVDFGEENLAIYGDNHTGKTTIADAFFWLLFGKDSLGQARFDIKPNWLKKPTVSVTGVLSVDGKEVKIQRILEEKYVKDTETKLPKYDGDTTIFYINAVPKTAKEFSAFVDSVITEDLFRRLTSAQVFLSMKKDDMKKVLLDMTDKVDESKILARNPDLKELTAETTEKGINVADYLAIAKSDAKRKDKERDGLMERIDELKNTIPEKQDWEKLEAGIEKGEVYLADLNNLLASARLTMQAKNDLAELENRITVYRIEMAKQANTEQAEVSTDKERLEGIISTTEMRIDNEVAKRDDAQKTYDELKKVLTGFNESYVKEKSAEKESLLREFEPIQSAGLCDKCGQAIPQEQLALINEEARKRFIEENTTRANDHAVRAFEILERGKKEKARYDKAKATVLESERVIADLTKEIKDLQSRVQVLAKRLEGLTVQSPEDINLENDPVYQKLTKEKTDIEKKVNADIDFDKVLANKEKVTEQLAKVKGLLDTREIRESSNTRLQELNEEAKELTDIIIKANKKISLAEEYLRTQMELMQDKINDQFTNVSFRMFSTNVDGTIADDCTPLVLSDNKKWTQYNTASNSERIRANMDIVKAMQKAHGISVPVFVDNAEACTYYVQLDTQVIYLHVSEEDKELRIEQKKEE